MNVIKDQFGGMVDKLTGRLDMHSSGRYSTGGLITIMSMVICHSIYG